MRKWVAGVLSGLSHRGCLDIVGKPTLEITVSKQFARSIVIQKEHLRDPRTTPLPLWHSSVQRTRSYPSAD